MLLEGYIEDILKQIVFTRKLFKYYGDPKKMQNIHPDCSDALLLL